MVVTTRANARDDEGVDGFDAGELLDHLKNRQQDET